MDVLGLDLVLNTESLTATFQMAALPPTTGTADLILGVGYQTRMGFRELTVRYVNGDPSVFVYDSQRAQKQSLDAKPQSQGSTITMVFPASVLSGIGNSFTFGFYTTLDGKMLDDSDGPAETFLPDLPA